MSDDDDDFAFLGWVARVDACLADRLGGLGVDDLPDQPYRDMYSDDLTPEDAAAQIIEDLDPL